MLLGETISTLIGAPVPLLIEKASPALTGALFSALAGIEAPAATCASIPLTDVTFCTTFRADEPDIPGTRKLGMTFFKTSSVLTSALDCSGLTVASDDVVIPGPLTVTEVDSVTVGVLIFNGDSKESDSSGVISDGTIISFGVAVLSSAERTCLGDVRGG